MKNKKYIYGFMALAILTIVATAVPAFADNTAVPANQSGFGRGMMGRGSFNRGNIKPGVFGTVSAISGNTISVSGKQGFNATAVATTFTIDATNAKITKNNIAGTISSILVGDTIMVQGTLTGTNVAATMIRDGIMRGGQNDQGEKMAPGTRPAQVISPVTGNGQPVVMGTVSSVNGSSIVITDKSNVSYTIDATNAKITQGANTILVSNLVTGDNVIVQGIVNGNSIVASSVVDQNKPAATTQPKKGFFGGIGSFFAHMFGF